jgi:hypothetical protein
VKLSLQLWWLTFASWSSQLYERIA